MYVVEIKFKSDGKSYNFSSNREYAKNEKVIVETEKGRQLGVVNACNERENTKSLKEVIGPATEDDYNKYLKNVKESARILKDTKELIKKKNINMSLIDASFSLDKKVLLFNFVSDERVDFRELVKELAAKYHTRIELHQIGVRDKAKEIGGIGLCGRVLCCNGCLKTVNSVNINMVKNQNIALNPTKINGACGRLLCCFTYENDIYEENRKDLPRVGEKVNYKGKQVEVKEIDILNRTYTVKISDNAVEEVKLD